MANHDTPSNTIVFSYIRWSSREQERGDTLRRQRETRDAYIARHNLTLDDALRPDKGKSAFRGRNASVGQLKEFLYMIDIGRVPKGSALIVEALDRLTRQKLDAALQVVMGILRNGVDIITLESERRYTKKDLDNMMVVMELMMIVTRGNNESETKSRRLTEKWAERRKAIAGGAKVKTTKPPSWVTWNKDTKTYELIPERAEVVRRIFALAIDGCGLPDIVATLNRENVPTFGGRERKNTGWYATYVHNILRGQPAGKSRVRLALGDMLQCTRVDEVVENDDGTESNYLRSVPTGDVIPGYYPAAIDEPTWYAAQSTVDKRRIQRGRRGPTIANLFTGILYDAVDGSPLVIHQHKSKGKVYLDSVKSKTHQDGASNRRIEYRAVENAMLTWLYEIDARDVVGKRPAANKGLDRLTSLTDDLTVIKGKIQEMTDEYLKSGSTNKVLAGVLKKLGEKEDETTKKLETAKAANVVSHRSESLGELQGVLELLKSAKDTQLVEYRLRLKSAILTLVERIDLTVDALPPDTRRNTPKIRTATARVAFRRGASRSVRISEERHKESQWARQAVGDSMVSTDTPAILADLTSRPTVTDLDTLRAAFAATAPDHWVTVRAPDWLMTVRDPVPPTPSEKARQQAILAEFKRRHGIETDAEMMACLAANPANLQNLLDMLPKPPSDQ